MLPIRIHPLCAILALLASAPSPSKAQSEAPSKAQGQPDRVAFLMVKPGDPAATEKRAEGFLSDLAGHLGERVAPFAGKRVAGRITNRRAEALRLLDEEHPALVFVPPGFWLEHLRDPKRAAVVVGSVPRFGKEVERYHLVAAKDGGPASLAALRGKSVHGTADIDWPYLKRVVFPAGKAPPEYFELLPSDNLADDVFAMVEPDDGDKPPDALLLDEALLAFFADDDLVWPHLRVIWSSPPLPRDLVVTLGAEWNDEARAQLVAALTGMSKDERGVRLLELMQSDGFTAPDRALLKSTTEAYDRESAKQKKPPVKR